MFACDDVRDDTLIMSSNTYECSPWIKEQKISDGVCVRQTSMEDIEGSEFRDDFS